MAAYVLVTEALENAAERGASRVLIRTIRHDEQLVVTVDDDGSGRGSGLVASADRVGAVGGTVEVGPTSVRAEIPCA
jgi:glucose-6-phosphate-specific signal transduction histidine kinase